MADPLRPFPDPGRPEVRVALTPSAAAAVAREGLGEPLAALRLPDNLQRGDQVLLSQAGRRLRLGVLRRVWLAGEGPVALEVTLDHPARG
jgi:hypothetical protein